MAAENPKPQTAGAVRRPRKSGVVVPHSAQMASTARSVDALGRVPFDFRHIALSLPRRRQFHDAQGRPAGDLLLLAQPARALP